MFSSIVQKLMISFLGDYIDGIRNSMNVALLKGRIKIQNVSLKREFFDNLSLPLRLGFSRVESIDVHIPWTNLKEKPTTVEVNGIYALFYVNYELSEYKFDVETRFQEMIDKATDMIKMKFEQKQRDSDSIVQKYILRIVDNLKVKVKNIHIRLESVERGWDFALGLLINRVSIHTVNQNGEKHFFVRSKHHNHPHLHRKHKNGEDTLYKKVHVQNIDLYFTENEKDFITLIQDNEAALIRMKSFLIDLQLHESTRNLTGPQIVMALKIEVMIRAKLNEHSKYDIDIKALSCPLQINLTDRMTAEILYFLQFAFQWSMQKYKKPNKDACMSHEMINFYKLVLANVLQDIPLHQQDYNTVLRLISEWTYGFLNQTTLEFIQDQKINREVARRKNHKILEDPLKFEQLKREIEDRILTEDQTKQIFDIIGRVNLDLTLPSIEIVLTKTEEAREMFGLKNPVILMMGLENISISFSTLFERDTTFTLAIEDFVLQQDSQRQSPQISTQRTSLESFMTVIYTRSEYQHIESCSIKMAKRVIEMNESFLSDILEWIGSIKLRSATVHYLKEIARHYFTEIVKKYLLRLFKEFRVINLNLGLPVFAMTLEKQARTIVVDCGKLEGTNLTDQMYRFELVEPAKVLVDENLILLIEEGTMMEIFDKLKFWTDERLLQLTDREKISVKVKSVRIQNIDKIMEFSCELIRSPIIEKFLRLQLIEDQSILLEGTFYLNNNPRKQRILVRSDSLHFLPSGYSIEMKRYKIYQMPLNGKYCLVLHCLVSGKTDVIEVETQQAMETIFYKIRELIHQNATGEEWDMFYKTDYAVMIDQLEVLKSRTGENMPLFSFQFEICKIVLPLERYLMRHPQTTSPISIPPLNVLNFLETNDTSYLQTNVSKVELDKIYLRIGFYQLSTDFFGEIRDVKLIIQDENLFKDFSLAISCLKSEYMLVNLNLHEFELSIRSQDLITKMLQMAFLFQSHVENIIRTIDGTDLFHKIQTIARENEEFSVLSSAQSFTEKSHQAQKLSQAWFQQRKKTLIPSQSLLSARLMFGMKKFKLNFLNYVTEIKHLDSDIEMYRGDYLPYFKLKIGEFVFLSSVQLINVRLCLQNETRQNFSYICSFNVDKVVVFEHVEFIVLALTEGDLGNLALQTIKMLEERKRLIKNKQKKPFSAKTEQKPHVKFENFISPIKQKPQETSSGKHLQHSIKSLAQSLFQDKQSYLFVFNANIKSFEAHVTLKDHLEVIHVVIREVNLKENELKIENVKINYGEREMLKCNGVEVKLPKRHLANEFQREHNVSLEMKFGEFESPAKGSERQPLLMEEKVEQTEKQTEVSQQVTQILVDGIKINVDIKIMSQIMMFMKNLSQTVQKSGQYQLLRRKMQELTLGVLYKREEIELIFEKGTQKLQNITEDIKAAKAFPYNIQWIIDSKAILKSFRVQTVTPLIVQLFSEERKELLHVNIGTKIDYPFYVNSFISFKVSHFNKFIQIYEPVVERTSIKLEKLDRKSEFRALIFDLKAVLSEELILDLCHDFKVVRDKLRQVPKSEVLLIEDLEFMKVKLYERWFGKKGLVEETLRDLEHKKRHAIESELEVFSEEREKLEQLSKRGVFSKLKVKNFTQCQVLCQLTQESFPKQQIQVLSQEQLYSSDQPYHQMPPSYFMLPYHKTTKKFTKSSDFLQRQFPLSLKLCFINQKYAFHSITFQTNVSEISQKGEMREYLRLVYEDGEGKEWQTVVELFMKFDYFQAGVLFQIRPKVEVVNCTGLGLDVRFADIQTFGKFDVTQKTHPVPKGQSMHLPFWADHYVSLGLSNYPSKNPASHCTIPLNSEYSLAQNYPAQNYLLVKEQFIHYFQVKLGSEFCWIPLLFLRLKKFEKIIDPNTKTVDFRQLKCKLIVMPLVKVQNHCSRELYINAERFSSPKLKTDKPAELQQAISFFLHHQYKESLNSILFAFYQKGFSYHITLPQNLYVSQALKFPSEVEALAPIALNLMTVKNQFGQLILHFYPIVEVIMELPIQQMKCQMSCKYGEQEKQKICQGMNVHIELAKTQNLPITRGQLTSYLITQDCRKLKFSLECERDLDQDQNRGYFIDKLPNKKSLGYIDVLGTQFSSSQSESSSSSSSSESISVSDYSESDSRVESRIIYVPTTTQQGEMYFAKYEMRRITNRFGLEEELTSVYTAGDVEEIRQGIASGRKYETFYLFELRCVPESSLDRKLIEQKLAKQVAEIPKMKEISKKVKSKLASKSLVLMIRSLNVSLVVRKTINHESYLAKFKGSINSHTLGERFQLLNLSIGDYEMNLSMAVDQKFHWNQIQLEQRINQFMINSITLQKHFNDSILQLHPNKFISVITGFSIHKPQIFTTTSAQISQKLTNEPSTSKSVLAPNLKLSKLLIEIPDNKTQTEPTHHFDIKLTDLFFIECMNWIIKMYPIVSPLVSTDESQSIITRILSSDKLSEALKKFTGLIFSEVINIRLSFISLTTKSAHQAEKNHKIKKEQENQRIEDLFGQISQFNELNLPKPETIAFAESRTMHKIFKYAKKIPFNVLQIQKTSIQIPEIGINGRISDDSATKFERDLLINAATGVLKGMKILGSTGSLMDYIEKKNVKKRQKITGLLNRLAKGSVRSFTGVLKAFSNGISQLTFDEAYIEEREEAMTQQSGEEKSSSSAQGFESFFLGIKSGFTGLMEQPVQNYQQQGAQGFITGSIKGLTGMFTKPLTGILDLGAKTLEGMRGQKKKDLIQQSSFLNVMDCISCRPLFHECSLIRKYSQTEYLAYVVLKQLLKRQENVGLISAFLVKQNPFNSDEKENENFDPQQRILQTNAKNILAIGSQKTYLITLGMQDGFRIVQKVMPHSFVKMVGRSQNGVCLVVREDVENEDEQLMRKRMPTEAEEVFIDPANVVEKEELYRIYKKLAQK